VAILAFATLLPVDGGVPRARAAIGCSISDGSTPDIVADHLELTQSVQDGLNGLPMIAGKRTFVRLYAHLFRPLILPRTSRPGSAGARGLRFPTGSCISDATLTVRNGARIATLEPLGTDGLDTIDFNRVDRFKRGDPAYGFLFELPTFATSGSTSITAEVNPNGTIPEANRANNVLGGGAPVSFQQVPRMSISFDRVSYSVGTTAVDTPLDHVAEMARWIQRAYPVPGVDWRARRINVGARTVDSNGNFTNLTCDNLNFRRLIADVGVFNLSKLAELQKSNKRLYSMIHDGDGSGGFMTGCALVDDPPFGPIASGPTGSPEGDWSWDTDGIYGDWYGAHEIGHTLDRRHVRCPGTNPGGPGPWPYPDGLISQQGSNPDAAVGFDVETRETYPHDVAHDIMSYCHEQWVSDVSYKLFGTHIVQGGPTGDEPSFDGGDDICVAGTLGVGKASPEQTHLLPTFGGDATEASSASKRKKKRGRFAVEMYDEAGALLVRERFTPLTSHPSAPRYGIRQPKVRSTLLVLTCLPFDPRAAEVVVVGPGREPLGTVDAGTSAPTVDVLPPEGTAPTASPSVPPSVPPTASPSPTPTGPAILFSKTTSALETAASTVRLSWMASDPDGDALSHLVQTSTDGGRTWRTVAAPTSAASLDIPRDNLVTGPNLFRVLTTDGIRVTSDVLASPLVIATTPPLLEIRTPSVSERVRSRQTLSLEAFAYDVDAGSLDGTAVRWTSDKDGFLGIGDQVTVTGLSVGAHSITVTATGPGGTTSRAVPIVVV
jgi:hypothetical protein